MIPVKSKKSNKGLGDEYRTPEWVWRPWHNVLNFKIDAACTESNKIDESMIGWTKKDDSLSMPDGEWAKACIDNGGAIWLNPPYSRAAGPLIRWVEKAYKEAKMGATVCMCLPADTSTNWFSMLWDRNAGIWKPHVRGYFVEYRVKFIHPRTLKPEGSPNFGTLIAVLEPNTPKTLVAVLEPNPSPEPRRFWEHLI